MLVQHSTYDVLIYYLECNHSDQINVDAIIINCTYNK